MTRQVTYWLGNRQLGASQMEETFDRQFGMIPPESIAYFCPQCGEVWARRVVQGSAFMVYTLHCERHDPGWISFVAGSLWLLWDRAHNEALPRAVLERELELCFRHWEKHNREEFST